MEKSVWSNFDLLASKLRSRVIIDGRNLYNPDTLRRPACITAAASVSACRARGATPMKILVTGARPDSLVPTVCCGCCATGIRQFGLDNFNDYYDPQLRARPCAMGERGAVRALNGHLADVSGHRDTASTR